MMTYIIAIIYCASCLCSVFTGRTVQAGQALLEGAAAAISFSISLAGGICLWSGITLLLEQCGGTRLLSRFLRPLLLRLFPRSCKGKEAMDALAENISANILGLGNAATPAGLKAARAMANAGLRDELCMLVVLNSASIQLIPSTIAAVRQSAGAAAAFDILPAVWFSSLLSLAAGLMAAGLMRRLWK